MTQSPELTAVLDAVGVPFALRAGERLLAAKLTDDSAVISIEYQVVTETSREWRISARGTRMLAWTNRHGRWEFLGTFSNPDPEFVPEVHIKYGNIVTPREARQQLEWERLCYRPGTDQTPLDNYDRTLEGLTTDRMERHW